MLSHISFTWPFSITGRGWCSYHFSPLSRPHLLLNSQWTLNATLSWHFLYSLCANLLLPLTLYQIIIIIIIITINRFEYKKTCACFQFKELFCTCIHGGRKILPLGRSINNFSLGLHAEISVVWFLTCTGFLVQIILFRSDICFSQAEQFYYLLWALFTGKPIATCHETVNYMYTYIPLRLASNSISQGLAILYVAYECLDMFVFSFSSISCWLKLLVPFSSSYIVACWRTSSPSSSRSSLFQMD